MRTSYLSVSLLLALSVTACSFQVGAGAGKPPATAATPASTATPAPAAKPIPTPVPRPSVSTFGRRTTPTVVTTPGTTGTTTGTSTTTPSTTTPSTTAGFLTGTNTFGTGTPDPNGWKGSFFTTSAGTTKMPALATMTPNGVLFAKELNVAATPMVGGFPGIDAARNQDFAIRWEAPLVVENEADYTLRIVSDDGAVVSIDGMTIVDNDGAHGLAEKSGPVHLVKGTHAIAVDYFQATGPVALQLFCKKGTDPEIICPTKL